MATTQASSADPSDTSAMGTALRPAVNNVPAVQPPARSGLADTPAARASRPSLADIIQAQEEIFIGRQPESARLASPGQQLARRRRRVQLADLPAAAGLAQPRPGLEALRRRRQRVRRPARRIRRLAGRPRPPGDRRGGPGPGRPRHALRPADGGRASRSPRTVRQVRPAAVAVRQLRHRGHDGRGAPDARDHRPRPHHQGRGLLPRPPRLGAGLGLPGRRRRRQGPADHPNGVPSSAGIPRASPTSR